MSRPRLLLVGPTPPPLHGTSVYTRMLLDAPALAEAFDVSHLDIADRRGLDNLGRLDPTNVWLAVRHLGGLALRMARDRPDVVYVQVSQNALAYLRDAAFIAVARLGGARVVTHLHGGHLATFYREAHPLVRAVVRGSSRLVARAWVLGDGLRHHYDGLVPPERVRVVANGVPGPAMAGPLGTEARSWDEAPTLLFLGQLSLAKGVGDLVDALAPVAHLPWRLVLAGGWLSKDDEAAVRERIEAHPLRERIELAGVVTGDAKARLFARADAFILPTRYAYEGQPLTVLEAMAAGLPVVATPRGAIPDMVADGESGLLVPEGDPVALGAALRRLLADPELRARLGREGRRRWEAAFTDAHCVGAFVAEMEDALARPREAPERGRGEVVA